MDKLGKGKALKGMCIYAFLTAKKQCADKKIELKSPAGFERKVTFDAFLEYCESCEKMEPLPQMLAKYVTAPYKHEYEKTKEKSEKREKLEKELAEAMAKALGI